MKLEIEDVEFTPTSNECELPTYDNSRSRTAPPVQKPAQCGCDDDDNEDDGSNNYGSGGEDKDKDKDHDDLWDFTIKFDGPWNWFKKAKDSE